jgi:hypothetical protein
MTKLRRNVRAQLTICFHSDYLLGLFFDPERGGDTFVRNVSWLFNGLHSIIFHEIQLLIIGVILHYLCGFIFRGLEQKLHT